MAALSLTAASAGGAMGWVMGGTSSTIKEYKSRTLVPVPMAGSNDRVERDAVQAYSVSTLPKNDAPEPVKAWFPDNNTVQWSTTVAPGQPLSAISLRNGDQSVNLIAHLTARGTNGGMVPVASMTVSPGRESVLHPPAGDYAMEIVTSPIDMPYDRIASLPRSRPASFSLPAQDHNAIPSVRFEVSKGIIRRLPDPNASRPVAGDESDWSRTRSTASRPRDEDEEYAYRPASLTDDVSEEG